MSRLSRRQMLALLGAGAVGATLAGLRPNTGGAPHPHYFAGLSRALKQAGIATPTLVIDRRQLHANVGRILHNLTGGEGRLAMGNGEVVRFSVPQLRPHARPQPALEPR